MRHSPGRVLGARPSTTVSSAARVPLGQQQEIARPVVLVVDDDEAVRVVAESDLEDAGYEPEIADAVSAALPIASRRRVDVVLLDIALPRGGSEKAQPRAGL